MKKINEIIFLCLVTLGCVNNALAQTAIPQSVRAGNVLLRFSQQNLRLDNSIMIVSSAEKPEIEGNSYWDEHWGLTALLLYERDKLVENYLTRYDIYKDEFEFQLSDGVRVLPGKKVRNIIWMDSVNKQHRYLVNAKEYREDNVPLTGFLEILVDGSHSLFKKIRLETLKPDFNPALNVGKKNTRILKKESYYFNNGNDLFKIKSRKSLASLFANKNEEMNLYIKKEAINLKEENDLTKLFIHFLSLQ